MFYWTKGCKTDANGKRGKMDTMKIDGQDYNKAEVRKVIARAAASVTPREDRCLRNKDYVKVMIAAWRDWREILVAPDEVLRKTCLHCCGEANKESQPAP